MTNPTMVPLQRRFSLVPALFLLGCGAGEPSGASGEHPAHGSISVALHAIGSTGHEYQLSGARLRFTGPTTRTVTSDPREAVLNVDLPAGAYNVMLLTGWQLLEVVDGTAETVPATLISQNPVNVSITEGEVTEIPLRFDVSGELIPFGLGRAQVTFDVWEGAPDAGGEAPCGFEGVYAVQPIAYSCCGGLVDVNVSAFSISSGGSRVTGSPSHPVEMVGEASICADGTFSNTGVVGGSCVETYSVVGEFTGPDTWSGVYRIQFSGTDCALCNCANQTFLRTGQR